MNVPPPTTPANSIDWGGKLRHLLQSVAFSLLVAAVIRGFVPRSDFAATALFSTCVGVSIWAFIDLGRHLIPSSQATGWPAGLAGIALAVVAILGGWVLGSLVADSLGRSLGLQVPRLARLADARVSLLITAVAGGFASYWFYSRSRSDFLLRQMQEAHRHADEARLKLLETQLEPHMLFNTLANLRALIAVDAPRAQQMLDHMIAYLRATLNASRATTHPLQSEFERLRDYLELMAIRMGPRLAFALALPPELAQQPVPTLLLQPLVENSIQHGLEPKVGGGRIDVRARVEGNALLLEVADTGVGSGDVPAQGKGFGLQQVRERLATLYGGRATLDFSAVPGEGARALIRLPLP